MCVQTILKHVYMYREDEDPNIPLHTLTMTGRGGFSFRLLNASQLRGDVFSESDLKVFVWTLAE